MARPLQVEPGDIPLSLEGVRIAELSDEQLQTLMTGEDGKTAEVLQGGMPGGWRHCLY